MSWRLWLLLPSAAGVLLGAAARVSIAALIAAWAAITLSILAVDHALTRRPSR
jgi:hypothetical protein